MNKRSMAKIAAASAVITLLHPVACAVTYTTWFHQGGGAIDDPASYNSGTHPNQLPGTAGDDYADYVLTQNNPVTMNGQSLTVGTVEFMGFNADLDFGAGKTLFVNADMRFNTSWGASDVRLKSGTISVNGEVFCSEQEPNCKLTVDGPDSAFVKNGGSPFHLGYAKSGNELRVINGGEFRGRIYLGSSGAGATGNRFTVSGAGSRYVIPSDLAYNVGFAGASTGNVVSILDGASVTNFGSVSMDIGRDYGWGLPAGGGNSLVVSNAIFHAPSAGLNVGYNSSDNSARFVDGSRLDLGGLTIGYDGASRSEVVVSNDTELTVRGTINVGSGGGFGAVEENRLVLSRGAELRAQGDLFVGFGGAGRRNVMVIDGAKVDYNPSGTYGLNVGFYGSGNRLEVINGGELVATNALLGIHLGRADACASGNVLSIRSGGVVRAHGLEVGYAASGNRLELENGSYLGRTDSDPRAGGASNVATFGSAGEGQEIVIRGTNSVFDVDFVDLGTATLTFEIPAEGFLPDAAMTMGYCGCSSVRKIKVTADSELFEKGGKFTLMKWNVGSDARSLAQTVFDIPKEAKLVVEEHEIAVKFSKGFVILLR